MAGNQAAMTIEFSQGDFFTKHVEGTGIDSKTIAGFFGYFTLNPMEP